MNTKCMGNDLALDDSVLFIQITGYFKPWLYFGGVGPASVNCVKIELDFFLTMSYLSNFT